MEVENAARYACHFCGVVTRRDHRWRDLLLSVLFRQLCGCDNAAPQRDEIDQAA